ncbi:hypothetical protein FRZ61_01360 [Hypericibacter adhaerens]|uniref:Uncharacterized protein n=1 Tax=Hypericibacter adhaerens TaxID=2602016 RepID=A0A5J6MVP1_9PROT|nr:hypothetical protein FRZ61_01360 [Hypericibacter adhaerens]
MFASARFCTRQSRLIGASHLDREVPLWRIARALRFGRSGAAGRASRTGWGQHRGSAVLIFSSAGRKSEAIRLLYCALIGSHRNRSDVISR